MCVAVLCRSVVNNTAGLDRGHLYFGKCTGNPRLLNALPYLESRTIFGNQQIFQLNGYISAFSVFFFPRKLYDQLFFMEFPQLTKTTTMFATRFGHYFGSS